MLCAYFHLINRIFRIAHRLYADSSNDRQHHVLKEVTSRSLGFISNVRNFCKKCVYIIHDSNKLFYVIEHCQCDQRAE